MTLHIQFCLDEIICEIEALTPTSLRDTERLALEGHVSSMRMLLAGCAARQAALALAMPCAKLSAIAESAAEGRAIEPSPAAIEALPPPVAPVPAPIRIMNSVKTTSVEPAVVVAPVQPTAKVITLPPMKLPAAEMRRSSSALTRIAASLLIVIGLGTGAVLHQLQAHDPLVGALDAELTQHLSDGHAVLRDVIEAGRKLMSWIPDLGGQKASG